MLNNFSSKTQSIQRSKGRVKAFDKIKGFGFIYGESGGRDIFVHHTDITNGSTVLEVNEIVEYTLVESPKGLQAKAVERISQTTNNNSNNRQGHHRSVVPPLDRVTQESYQDLKEICTRIIDDTLGVATEFEKLITPPQIQKINIYNVDNLQNLSYRAESELLTLAFFGPFSAGKSFLISSLIGRLDWFSHPHMGVITDQYVPLIPGSPRPTSSCPLVIEPASQKDREDQFFIQFEGNTLWERISPVITPIIQAYVTDLPHAIGQRRPADRRRKVLKARLVITDTQISARLYDLPGLGAIGNKFADLA
jgi:CspA family cold shock protein